MQEHCNTDMMYCSLCGQLLNDKPSEINEILTKNPDIMQQIVSEVTKKIENKMKFEKLAEERFQVMVRG